MVLEEQEEDKWLVCSGIPDRNQMVSGEDLYKLTPIQDDLYVSLLVDIILDNTAYHTSWQFRATDLVLRVLDACSTL